MISGEEVGDYFYNGQAYDVNVWTPPDQRDSITDVNLFYMPGVSSDVTIRHAGPVGFLAAKADALVGRHDSKDGYDVAWVPERRAHPG